MLRIFEIIPSGNDNMLESCKKLNTSNDAEESRYPDFLLIFTTVFSFVPGSIPIE